MRDPFGVHERRVRRALGNHLRSSDAIEAFARDDAQHQYWVLTTRSLFQLDSTGSVVTGQVLLADWVGSVSRSSVGVEVRVSAKHATSRMMVGTFRSANTLTDRLAELLGTTEPED